jgi:hypothetical protein
LLGKARPRARVASEEEEPTKLHDREEDHEQ